MKYLGLDLGSRTLGVAISDALGMIARVYETYRFKDDDYDSAVTYTIDIIKKEKIDAVILGYPKHMNGDVGIRGKISEEFKRKLEEKTSCKIILLDERLSTVAANNIMLMGDVSRKRRKEKKDELAAVIILQNYLDRR